MKLLEGNRVIELTQQLQQKENELKKESERCLFFEKSSKEYADKYNEKMDELEEAHAIIGRLTHQLSKRWDVAPLTKYMSGLLK